MTDRTCRAGVALRAVAVRAGAVAERDEVRGILRRIAPIVPLFAVVALLMMGNAAQAVVDATPTPGTPPPTVPHGDTSEVPSIRMLDSSPLRGEQVLASEQGTAGARSAVAAGAAPLH
jgi:hypothetical protein